jgi:hypothetical protein
MLKVDAKELRIMGSKSELLRTWLAANKKTRDRCLGAGIRFLR